MNFTAIALLSRVALMRLHDYRAQRAQGYDPVFTRDRRPEVRGIEFGGDELRVLGPIPVTKHPAKQAKFTLRQLRDVRANGSR